ncbi:MAG: CPBP family intramembrane metalloprotease [Clostridiales bacterium]|nr:CPBP family intramembrane metalloprotease [Clostridiales bacterium]
MYQMNAPLIIYDWGLFRRDVRRDVRNCALFVLLMFAVISVAMFALGIASEADNVLTTMIVTIASSCVFFMHRGRRYITDLALPMAEPLTPRIFLVLIVASQGIQLASGMLTALLESLLPEGLSVEETYAEAVESLLTPLGIISIVAVAPVVEELVFRGAVLGALRKFGDNFAILFSSLIFAFYHMLFAQIPYAFLMGLVFGYVAVRWSLRAAIALHAVTNAIAVGYMLLPENALAAGVSGLVLLACAIATFAMLIGWRRQLGERIRAGAAYYPRTYAYGFSSIAFWLFIVITAGMGAIMMVAPLLGV